MTEERSKEQICHLDLMLLRHGGVTISYDANAGLQKKLCLTGRIDDRFLAPSL